MEEIRRIGLGIVILALMINFYGQGLAKKEEQDSFDLAAVETRKIAVKSDRLWTQGIIPFEMKEFSAYQGDWLIKRAIKFWESKTCVKFIELDKEIHQDWLSFAKSESNCRIPSLGKAEKKEYTIHFGRNCTYEIIVRELGHAMGFAFEKDPEYEELKNKADENEEAKKNPDSVYQCPSCGAIIQQQSGTFGTMNPSGTEMIDDKDNNACEWRIIGSRGEKIDLKIDSLNIYQTPNCTTDYIEVRDGFWSGSPLLGRFCSNEKIPLIKSKSDRLLVTYKKTSDKKDYKGFTASYNKTCGGDIEINNNVEILESPAYPNVFPANSRCTWKISYPKNKTLSMTNYFFSLQKSETCKNNFVEIREGYNSTSASEKFCGTHMSSKLNATGGHLIFDFYSETPEEGAGFSVLFQLVSNETKTEKMDAANTQVDDQKVKKTKIGNQTNGNKTKTGKSKDSTGSASHQSFNLTFLGIFLFFVYIFVN